MTFLVERSGYSYRDDPSVPAFDDTGPVVFMDGDCALCSFGARTICRMDRGNEFKICPTQSDIGQKVLLFYGLRPDDPDTWLYIVDGRAYTSLDAIIRVGKRLGGVGRLLAVFSVLPRGLQDWLYRLIARNRYRLFGRVDYCEMPDSRLKDRLIG